MKLRSVQNIITFRWQLTYNYVFWHLFIPYLLFLTTFLIFIKYVYEQDERLFHDDATIAFRITEASFILVIIIYSLYFLTEEILQCISEVNPFDYFSNVWNYVDAIPPILILWSLTLDYFDVKEVEANESRFGHAKLILMTTASFGMWLKLFYFLRIFRETGFFVNMMTQIIYNTKTFMLLYLLIHIAYAQSFFILSKEENFIVYVYLLGMGEFDTEFENYDAPEVTMFFFFSCTVIINIVMLNILIALVSDAYGKINSERQEANDQERIRIIEELQYMVTARDKKNLCQDNERIIIAYKTADGQRK